MTTGLSRPTAPARPRPDPGGGAPRRGSGTVRRDAVERRMARTGWLYTAPSLLVIGGVTIFPIVFSLVLSFSQVRITYDGFAIDALTFGNYVALLSSSDWYYALGFTVFYTVVTVAVEVVLGTMAALVMERLGAGRAGSWRCCSSRGP